MTRSATFAVSRNRSTGSLNAESPQVQRHASQPLPERSSSLDSRAVQHDDATQAHRMGDADNLHGHQEAALHHYARATRLAPNRESHRRALWNAIGRVYGGATPYPFRNLQLTSGNRQRACSELGAIANSRARGEFLAGTTKYNLMAGRVPWVFAALIQPTNAEAQATAAQGLFFFDSWHQGAEAFLRRATQLAPHRGDYAYSLGNFYEERHKLTLAREAYSAAHARAPRDAAYQKAFTRVDAQCRAAAEEAAQLQRCPHAQSGAEADALARQHSLRQRHAEALPHLERAISGYSEALAQAPNNSVYRKRLKQALHTFVSHMCHLERHDDEAYERGKEHARKLIELEPAHGPLLAKFKRKHSHRWWRVLARWCN